MALSKLHELPSTLGPNPQTFHVPCSYEAMCHHFLLPTFVEPNRWQSKETDPTKGSCGHESEPLDSGDSWSGAGVDQLPQKGMVWNQVLMKSG